jgi:hypothetical protein
MGAAAIGANGEGPGREAKKGREMTITPELARRLLGWSQYVA